MVDKNSQINIFSPLASSHTAKPYLDSMKIIDKKNRFRKMRKMALL
jgi:hypothetical protein